jgi:hypothetical protein
LVFYLASTAFDGEREKFMRLLIMLITTAAAGTLVLMLGPYPVAGFCMGTLASRAYVRRNRR